MVDPNRVTTELGYDQRLRLQTSTVVTAAGNLTTTYLHDPPGNLTKTVLPGGAALTNSYDPAHRLVGITDLFNQKIAYTLDLVGDRTMTSLTDASAVQQRQHSAIFDALGRVLQDIGGVGQTTVYAYDGNDNPVTVTDPLGHATQNGFDALNRKVKVTDPNKGVTTIIYDAHDRPLSITDPKGDKTSFVYDGFGDLIERISPDTGTTTYSYDLAGNLVQSKDAAAVITKHTYDVLDRLTSTTYPGDPAENVTYTYDQASGGFGIGRLTTVKDAAGTLTRKYDERGNVINETRNWVLNGAGSTISGTLATAYTYDAASRLASITYPSGVLATYTRDAMGQVKGVTAKLPGSTKVYAVASNATYKPFGPATGFTYGNGVPETRTFDLDYRESGLSSTFKTGALQKLGYGYDAADNMRSISDSGVTANSQTLGYDILDRLNYAAGAYGTLGWTYDGVGNRLTQSLVQGKTSNSTTYKYAPTSNRLASITAATVTAIDYTPTGNIADRKPAGGTVTGFAYNQSNRLAKVQVGSSQAAAYSYDALGQRLTKSVPTMPDTLFQYDQDGRLLEEIEPVGKQRTDHVYLNGAPIAQILPEAGQVYFIHDDRLGTPQLATDTLQRVAWKALSQPFGSASLTVATVPQNLRLPGQYFDAETGLHQNGFRDYDPTLGRYIESDPVGLGGGLNTYQYARLNPFTNIDPSGLLCDDSESSLQSYILNNPLLRFIGDNPDIGWYLIGGGGALLTGGGLFALAPEGAVTAEIAAQETEALTVVHYTSAEGLQAIIESGTLRAGTYVTLPTEVEGLTASEIETSLEIQPGRAAFSTTFEVPQSQLVIPENGPLTSGSAVQFQLIEPVTPGPFTPTPE